MGAAIGNVHFVMFQIMCVCNANADANRTSFLHPSRPSAPWFMSSSAIPHSTRVLRRNIDIPVL
jgi:hypothetical protein